jgi:NifB/MoaA-like Fe-S oxidoreductase
MFPIEILTEEDINLEVEKFETMKVDNIEDLVPQVTTKILGKRGRKPKHEILNANKKLVHSNSELTISLVYLQSVNDALQTKIEVLQTQHDLLDEAWNDALKDRGVMEKKLCKTQEGNKLLDEKLGETHRENITLKSKCSTLMELLRVKDDEIKMLKGEKGN